MARKSRAGVRKPRNSKSGKGAGRAGTQPQPSYTPQEQLDILAFIQRNESRDGSWVLIRELIPAMEKKGWPMSQIHRALLEMYSKREINLTIHDHNGSVTPADRKYAVRLGVDDQHFVKRT